MQLENSVQDLRAFLPAADFAISRSFYQALGFAEVWSSDKMALLQLGRFSFFLQDYFVKEWAENMMLDVRVVDVDAFFAHLQSLNLSSRFPTTRLGAPQDDPGAGIRRGSFTDPAGVLWHFSQSSKR